MKSLSLKRTQHRSGCTETVISPDYIAPCASTTSRNAAVRRMMARVVLYSRKAAMAARMSSSSACTAPRRCKGIWLGIERKRLHAGSGVGLLQARSPNHDGPAP